jgi:phosphoribosylglycinamide formyltransferase-1
MVMKRIGWFTTARGPGSYNLFKTMMASVLQDGSGARLSFVFINRDIKENQYRRRIVRMAEESGIPVIICPSDTFMPELKERDVESWRNEYGKELRKSISQHKMDFGVLAGYMLIMDPESCRRYDIINLHPALPDTYKGTWEEIVGQVVDNRDECYGATVHLVTPELDRGQTIAYDSFRLDELRERYGSRMELINAIRAEEVKREAHLLMASIKLLVDGELMIKKGKLYDGSGEPVQTYPCLASAIDRKLGKG